VRGLNIYLDWNANADHEPLSLGLRNYIIFYAALATFLHLLDTRGPNLRNIYSNVIYNVAHIHNTTITTTHTHTQQINKQQKYLYTAVPVCRTV
jgi:hypothetical protein